MNEKQPSACTGFDDTRLVPSLESFGIAEELGQFGRVSTVSVATVQYGIWSWAGYRGCG